MKFNNKSKPTVAPVQNTPAPQEKPHKKFVVAPEITEWINTHKLCGQGWQTGSWAGIGWEGDKMMYHLTCFGCGADVQQLTPTSPFIHSQKEPQSNVFGKLKRKNL